LLARQKGGIPPEEFEYLLITLRSKGFVQVLRQLLSLLVGHLDERLLSHEHVEVTREPIKPGSLLRKQLLPRSIQAVPDGIRFGPISLSRTNKFMQFQQEPLCLLVDGISREALVLKTHR
jgi:hypothetical protein